MTAEELYKKLSAVFPDIWWAIDDMEGVRIVGFEVEETFDEEAESCT